MNYALSSIKRAFKFDLGSHPVSFLWGPRKVGKTTLLKQKFPDALYIDLLKSEERTRFLLKPELLRQELATQSPTLVIIDEVQKVPALLDEVHWLIENTSFQFILCGSSARKLRHGASNLLGGRAYSFNLFPLTTKEIANPDLTRILNHGFIPQHYLAEKPERLLHSYLSTYIQEEIIHEALTRKIPEFSRFLEAVASSHGGLINYKSISGEAGVNEKTVREYFQILEDTLLGHRLEPWHHSKKRRLITTPKFYLFDLGIVRALQGMPLIQSQTDLFGNYFEHFLIEEMRAYLSYTEKYKKMFYWRTSTGFEVDLIVGEMEVAVEFKSGNRMVDKHLKGLRALKEDYPKAKYYLVCNEERARKTDDDILILPWKVFCTKLWHQEIV